MAKNKNNNFKNAQRSSKNDFRDSQDNNNLRNGQDNNLRNAQNSSRNDNNFKNGR